MPPHGYDSLCMLVRWKWIVLRDQGRIQVLDRGEVVWRLDVLARVGVLNRARVQRSTGPESNLRVAPHGIAQQSDRKENDAAMIGQQTWLSFRTVQICATYPTCVQQAKKRTFASLRVQPSPDELQ